MCVIILQIVFTSLSIDGNYINYELNNKSLVLSLNTLIINTIFNK